MALGYIFQFLTFLCVSIALFNLALSACPSDWLNITTGGNPSQACFKVFSSSWKTFDDAASFCQTQGGYLARDTSQTIHDSLKPYLNDEFKASTHPVLFWIGLTDNNGTNGTWQWVGGPALGSYQNFAVSTNTPNKKDCIYISAIDSNMRWVASPTCDTQLAFVCQRDLNASAVVLTTLSPLNCPSGWVGFTAQKTCIKLFTTSPNSWSSARAACLQNYADLVKIGNTAFNNFINIQVSSQKDIYWIGLNDRANDGKFVWLDETNATSFTSWDSNMPNDAGGDANCVALDANKNFKWSDGACSMPNRYICQRNPLTGTPTARTATTQSDSNCGDGWEDIPNSDGCFKFNTNVLSWLDARSECQTSGGDLASVINVQEQSYLTARSLSFSSNIYWIGANDRSTEKGWRWTDGSPFAFLNWDAKQPDNSHDSDCAALVQQTGMWDDLPCQNRHGYICKKKGKVTLPPLYTTSTTPAQLPGDVVFACPNGWMNYRGSCYKFVSSSTGVDFATASSSCSDPSVQGALVSIIDQTENDFLFSFIPHNYSGNIWIGFQDPRENTFTWVDGTPVQYTNWNPGEPNNVRNEDCVVMKSNNGKWNDVQCSSVTKLYICKRNKSIMPNSDSNLNQGCSNIATSFEAHCYTFISSQKNFTDAQKNCRNVTGNQGNLVTIDSGYLQDFLSAQVSLFSGQAYWIGLSQKGATYTWQSNWPATFTNWGKNHTGNERYTCVAMQQADPTGLWVNYPCSTVLPHICESPRTGYTTQTTRTSVTRQQPCPAGWLGYGGLCYKAFNMPTQSKLPWGDARDFCASQANGGSLLTVSDNATQDWLLTNINDPLVTSGVYWIGLNDRDSESGYIWEDHSPFLFTNWAVNEPNDAMSREDCVVWDFHANAWSDQYCYVSNSWICQVPRGTIITTAKPVPTAVASPQCGDATWVLFNNFCYFVSKSPLSSLVSWFDARQRCLDVGADLASITGEDENGFLTSLITQTSIYSFWIGLNDLDMDTYGWTDLSPVSYVAWSLNEPNDNFGQEKCVELNVLGSWNDDHCQTTYSYICKKRPGNFSPNPYIPTVPSGGCPTDFKSTTALSFCYYVGGTTNDTRMSYDDALTSCKQLSSTATLASIHTTFEEKYILILVADLRVPAWIGFNDRKINNQFLWVDNLNVSYTNWGPGQPNENIHDNNPSARRDCVDMEVRRNPGTWNDRQCDTPLAYVCESRKNPSLPLPDPDTTGCHAGYIRFHNSCYQFFSDSLNWTVAQSICKADYGNLVTFNSGVEQAAAEIMTQSTQPVQFWIGLKYMLASSTFNWIDNWPVRYTNWGKDEPKLEGDQSCVSHTVDGQWQVVPCNMQLPFVCEVNFGSAPPPRGSNMPGRCPDSTWTNYAGNCYHIETSTQATWGEANAACSRLGANLTSIHSTNESSFLLNTYGNLGQDVWIGLFKGQATGFAWYDGTATEYTNWAVGEPNDPDSYLKQDCVKVVSSDGSWADTDCTDQNGYICKTPQRARPSWDPNGTRPTQNPNGSRPSLNPNGSRPSWDPNGTRPSWDPNGSRPTRNPNGSRPSLNPNGSRPSWDPNGTRPTRGPSRITNQGYSRSPFTGSTRFPNRRSSSRRFTGQTAQTAANLGGSPSGSSSGSDLSGGAVGGIIVGTLVLVALVAVVGIITFRYFRGQTILPFSAQRLTSPVAGFKNVTYSSGSDDKVSLPIHESYG